MFSAWLLLQIIILFFYKNLTDFTQSPAQSSKVLTINEDLDENTPITTSHSSVNSNKNYNSIQQTSNHQNENETNQDLNEIRNEEGEDIAESEHEHLITSQSAPKTHEQNRVKLKVKDNAEAGPLIVRLYNEYIKEEVVCVLVCSFSVFFMQTALEVRCFYFYFSFKFLSKIFLIDAFDTIYERLFWLGRHSKFNFICCSWPRGR